MFWIVYSDAPIRGAVLKMALVKSVASPIIRSNCNDASDRAYIATYKKKK